MVSSRAGLTTVTAAAAAAFAMFTSPASAASNSLTNQYQVINSDSLASAMMLGLINEDYVYILDKVENNKARLPGTNKPVWGSILSLSDNSVTAINVNTNTFCASGGTLGNGSWIVAGGNSPVTYGGADPNNTNVASTPYQDYDGRRAIRILNPVASGSGNSTIAWVDTPGGDQMQSQRWYPGVESLADGSMVLIGGATNGGYINRNYPNVDPAYEGTPGQGSVTNLDGGANPTYEFWPSKGDLKESNFMVNTSGLNMYAHMFLLPSGNIFMQANYSTTIWNYTANTENHLPDMPDEIVRVYPASGATAMLPLTAENNYTPEILFCGGTSVPADQWGDYGAPWFNPLTTSASADCSSIIPENADGSVNDAAAYLQEEQLPEPRTMGQFIHLPNGKMVIVNGAEKGTAGYGNVSSNIKGYSGNTYTWSNSFNTSNGTVYTEAFSQDPTYTPVLYDPTQPRGSRLSRDGFGQSQIARLYHSSALLLPDGSVLVAGSNPHVDVSVGNPASINGIQVHDTEYRLEKWYPSYYFEDRPQPQNLPDYILYGGNTWTFSITNTTFLGDEANYLANATEIYVIRPGFSTHAMNMGQRSLKLSNSYTVNDDGTVDYTVMPMPSNVNLFAPGPALLFVTVNGVPSAGKQVMIGQQTSGGTIPHDYAADAGSDPTLPQSTTNSKYNKVPSGSGSSSGFGTGAIVGVAVGAAVLILLILLGLLCWRRQANKRAGKKAAAAGAAGAAGGVYRQSSYHDSGAGEYKRVNTPQSSVAGFAPRGQMATYDSYRMDNVSGPNTPYYDNPRESRGPMSPGAPYEQQGWGEHHGGDAGDFYKENFDSAGGAGQYYDQASHASRR